MRLAAFAAVGTCVCAARADFLGMAWRDGTLIRIDQTTGAGTILGTLGPPGTANALAMNAQCHLYTTRNIDDVETLLRIDPATGAVISSVPLTLVSVRELAFGPDGTLYALNIPSTPSTVTELHRIDPLTGQSTYLGASNLLFGVQGMAFSPSGELYGWNVFGYGLVKINPVNGHAASTWGPSIKGIQALAFGPDGTLYGAEHELYTIDFNTGQAILIAPITLPPGGPTVEELSGVRGLVWFPGACYPDCNSDGALNLADFGCFQTNFALGDPYADCNHDASLNLADFGCFQTQFAIGCP